MSQSTDLFYKTIWRHGLMENVVLRLD